MALDAVDRTKEEASAGSPPMQRIWVKRKRSERRRAGSSNSTAAATAVVEEDRTEEEDLAVILMMLSRDRSGGSGSGSRDVPPPPPPTPFDLDSSSGTKLVYSCSICGKAFDSYQALGGHKTSHRKPVQGDVDAAVAAASSDAQQQEKVHRCLICLKTFPSGQALGGHKRKHYEGPALKMKLDLDLNMPPASEEEAPEVLEEIDPEAKNSGC